MNDSTEHTVRETSPTPPLRHSLQGPLLRRNADTQMQLWGGKDEETAERKVQRPRDHFAKFKSGNSSGNGSHAFGFLWGSWKLIPGWLSCENDQ